MSSPMHQVCDLVIITDRMPPPQHAALMSKFTGLVAVNNEIAAVHEGRIAAMRIVPSVYHLQHYAATMRRALNDTCAAVRIQRAFRRWRMDVLVLREMEEF